MTMFELRKWMKKPRKTGDAQRISRLILGVCIASIWLMSVGSWVVKNGLHHWIDVKSRRDKSYFRLG